MIERLQWQVLVRIVDNTAHPTIVLVHTSVTTAVQQNPCQVQTKVTAATRSRLGLGALN